MRRTALLLVATALAACSADDGAGGSDAATQSSDGTEGTDSAGTDGTDGTDPADGTGGTDGAGTDGTDATDGSGTDGTDGAPLFQYGPLDLVTDQTYDRLLIEVDYVEGRAPNQDVQDRMLARLNDLRDGGYLGKPGGVRLVLDEQLAAPPDPGKQSFQELDAVAKGHRSLIPEPGEMSVYVLYVNGGYQGDDGNQRILGFAYGGSWVVMLQDNIDSSCNDAVGGILLGDTLCNIAGASVLIHELGHLFGLVNNGLEMVTDHQDEEHGHHDENDECIMYWLNERSGMTEVLASRLSGGDDTIPPFDAACLADLAAAQ